MGQIVTFYSYKGGVGRTSALANVGVLLARWGYNTLVVDWDLEAPGLEIFYRDYLDIRSVTSREGILDLLTSHSRKRAQAVESLNWNDLIVDVQLPQEAKPLHMLTAGRIRDDYFTKLRDFDVDKFYGRKQGGLFLERLRGEWRETFDFVLLDSRTGITDIGGICTAQLPDVLILFFTASEQAFQGAIDVASKAQAARQKLPVDRLKLLCVPIASKFDSDKEFRLSQKYLSEFALQLSDVYADWLPKEVSPGIFLEATKVPYNAYFSFGSNLAVIEQGTNDPSSLGYAYETLAGLIANNLEGTDQLVSNRSGFIKSAIKSYEYQRPVFQGIRPPFGTGDKDFLIRVQQIIATESSGQFSVLIEEVRDRTVSPWRTRLLSKEQVDNPELQRFKDSEFIPAMRALTLLGLMIIKYSADDDWFERVSEVLVDIFDISSEMGRRLPAEIRETKSQSLEGHYSHTVPSLESLLSATLLSSYDLTKNKQVRYFSKLFRRVVSFQDEPSGQPFSVFFLFWPYFFWSPNAFIESLVSERYGNGSIVEDFFPTPESVKISVLQANCLLEWHSFMSFPKLNEIRAGEPETVQFFKDKYPSVVTSFHPSFFHEPPPLITPLVLRLWEALTRRGDSFLSLDPELDSVIAGMDIDRRKQLLGRFLINVRRGHEEWMFQQRRHPYSVDWPRQIQAVIDSIPKE